MSTNMLAAAWICRNCLSRIGRPLLKRTIRLQSSGKSFKMEVPALANPAKAASSESIPPALLARAQAITSEHKQLTDKLSNGFDTRAAKKLGEYGPIVNALGEWNKANEVSIRRAVVRIDAVTDLD